MNAKTPRVRLVTLGDNPFPDIDPSLHRAARDLIGVVRQLGDDNNVHDIAQFHNQQNLNGAFDDTMVRRLTAYALRSDDERPQAKESRFQLHTIPELMARPYSTWIVRDLMPSTGLAVVYGGPGSGKTFLMLDMAMAIARGMQWHGRRTRQGAVVYIAGEGAMRGRVTAYLKHNDLDEDDVLAFFVLESTVNLLDPAADALDLIDAIRAKIGERPVRMIVVDTLARSMPGGNENASEDMGAVISSASKVASAFNCLLAFVHHSGKDDTKGSRGHSSLKGACDVEVSVRRDGEVREAFAEKVRDGADQATVLAFRLESVDLGPVSDYDPEADPWERVTSCVVATGDMPEKVRPPPTHKNQGLALTAIKTGMEASGRPVMTAEEALKCIRAGTGMERNRAHEAIAGLIKSCYLKHSSMGGIEVIRD